MANTDVTLGNSRKVILSNQERAQGFTHKYTVKYTDSGSPSALTAGECDIYLAMHSANSVG